MPKYMLLLHDNPAAFANVSPDQMQKVVEKVHRVGQRSCAKPGYRRPETS